MKTMHSTNNKLNDLLPLLDLCSAFIIALNMLLFVETQVQYSCISVFHRLRAYLNQHYDSLIIILNKLRVLQKSFIYYIHKHFRKTNISYPLILKRTCAYQGVRNVSFSENFASVLNEWSLNRDIIMERRIQYPIKHLWKNIFAKIDKRF